MNTKLFLFTIATTAFVSGVSFADEIYLRVKCLAPSTGESTFNDFIAAEKSDLTMGAGSSFTLQGRAVKISRAMESNLEGKCRATYVVMYERCQSARPWVCTQFPVSRSRNWNVLVANKAASTISLSCSAGSTLETYDTKAAWIQEALTNDAQISESSANGVSSTDCLLDSWN